MFVVTPGKAVPDPVGEDVLDDLRDRLRDFRAVTTSVGVGWNRGTDPDYLADLVDYWAQHYAWRPHEERLRALPWRYAGSIRAVHADGSRVGGGGLPVVLLHGWPDSFYRFDRLLPLLSDLNIVVPCLPGFPYADPVTSPDVSAATMARDIAEAMTELGFDRFVVSGGDVGSSVAEQLAELYPDRVAALHLTDLPWNHLFQLDPNELTEQEQAYRVSGQRWQLAEGAYALEQATRPHTLAAGLGDSPAGLAAWLVEKLRGWSDCGGDVESVFPRDDLLTWITLYWVTGTIATSFLSYAAGPQPTSGRIEVPTAVTSFPGDLLPEPRHYGERLFDIRIWDEQPDGGHFGAWERPEVYAAAVRATLALA